MSSTPRANLVGMLHLPALPGRPNHDGRSLDDVVAAAVTDARVLEQAGFDAILVQNSLDRPTRERVDAATIAQLTVIAASVREAVDLELGINVVKNDGPAAVAIAAAVGASFVRVKVHTGVVLSAEGLVAGAAEETLQLRARLGAGVEIWSDVHDPTSRPLMGDSLTAAAVDAIDFGGAEAVIITQATVAQSCEAIETLRPRLPRARFVIGGKADLRSIGRAAQVADAVIVGSALKRDPGIVGRIDLELAAGLVEAAGATEALA